MDLFGCYFLIFQIILTFSIENTHGAKLGKDSIQTTDLKTSEDTTPNRDFRWSFFYFLEKKCTRICKGYGKPYGRMQGSLCRCYCPIIAPDWTLCAGTTPSCDNFCRAQNFRLGGGCIHEPDECYCYCYPQEYYNASLVYSKPPASPKPSKPYLIPLKPIKPINKKNNVTAEGPLQAPENKPLDSLENRPPTGGRPSLGPNDPIDLPFINENQYVSNTFTDGHPPSSVHEVVSVLNASNILTDPKDESDSLHHSVNSEQTSTLHVDEPLEAVSSLGLNDSVITPLNNENQNVLSTILNRPLPSIHNVLQEFGSMLNSYNIVPDSLNQSSNSGEPTPDDVPHEDVGSSLIITLGSNTDPKDETVNQDSNSSDSEEIPDVDISYHTSEDVENMDIFDYIIHADGFDYDTIINEYTDADDIVIEEEYSEFYGPISRRGSLSDKD